VCVRLVRAASEPPKRTAVSDQADATIRIWAKGGFAKSYRSRLLRPAEAVVLIRYAEALGGRVLELGCGTGRVTGYLGARGARVTGIDVSEEMIEHARRLHPDQQFVVGDLRDLSRYADGRWDAIIASFNVLGVLDDEERRRVLGELADMLTADGVLYFSAHNRATLDQIRSPFALVRSAPNPIRALYALLRAPARTRNRRRLQPLERNEAGYAIANDAAHDFQLLHYYIDRDAQERQLREVGLQLVECLDPEGRVVPAGAQAREFSELHYVARGVNVTGATAISP
jgi:SAM-dependent methyltransferase